MNTKIIGNHYENIAAEYLISIGHEIIERNYRSPVGEIDIISIKDNNLHITEVKKIPASWDINDIESKLSYSKINKIKRTCSYYLAQSSVYKYDNIIFDVVCIFGNNIVFWEGAFQ